MTAKNREIFKSLVRRHGFADAYEAMKTLNWLSNTLRYPETWWRDLS